MTPQDKQRTISIIQKQPRSSKTNQDQPVLTRSNQHQPTSNKINQESIYSLIHHSIHPFYLPGQSLSSLVNKNAHVPKMQHFKDILKNLGFEIFFLIVPLSLCPFVLFSHFPIVILSHCPFVLFSH